jgi:ATP-dependent exoDNAse (exonuclease V) beta subunit
MSNKDIQQNPFRSPEVRVVEASAGSGKTYALAKRYVQLLLNPSLKFEQIPIRNILALTFTNKAAFEMKARILEFLKRIALKQLFDYQEEDLLKPLGLTADQASRRAFEVMEGIIRHYNFFQVQTIDKFINALLSGCAFKIGLTANFKIKTNSGEYLQYSLDQLVDRACRDKDIRLDFEDFLHHYLYLENRLGWFPKDDMLAIVTALFEQSNTYGSDFKQSIFTSQDVIKHKRSILSSMKDLREVLPEGTHAGFIKAFDKFLSTHDKGFDIDKVSDYFARDEAPVKKGVNPPREVGRLWERIGHDLKQLCVMESYSLFNPYIRMFTRAMDGFYALSAKDDCLFLNELNKRACQLFDEDHVTVEELYYRLATRFHHYLIDEFQDTSRLQWHNLEKMTEEALSVGGTLFYVGDRKQAIYGFRGGDVGLFDEIKNDFAAFDVQVDLLTNNWRSQKQVVEFNNQVFSLENLRRFIQEKETYEIEKKKKNSVHFSGDDIGEINAIFSAAVQAPQVKGDGGYVKIESIDIDKKEDRDLATKEKVLSLIKDLRKRFSYRDIAILTRGNQEIKEVTGWLLEAGIPVESERTSDIRENSIIQELAAFLKFLYSPIDNLAFATFILGDLFTAATGLSKEEMHKFIFSLRSRLAGEKGFYIYTEFRSRYKDVWNEFVDEFFSNVGLYPLYELLITIYSRFKALEICREAQGFLMHFLELAKKSEDEHTDIASFLDYFENIKGEDLYVHVTDSDAVKLLTIHKSKGLEFPVVILPFLGVDIQTGSRIGEFQPSYILNHTPEGMELLRMKDKYRKFSPQLDEVYAREYKKAFLSELNSIYVALTRPRCELYGFIPKKVGNSFNLTKFLIPDGEYCAGRQMKYETKPQKGVDILNIPPAEYPDWIEYLRNEFMSSDKLRNRKQRLKGEAAHFALSMIGNLNDGDKKDIVRCALEEMRAQFAHVENLDACAERVQELIESSSAKPFFYCEGAQVFNEREIVNSFGYTKRCDRLIVFDNEVWVVDFKTGKEGQVHDREQVQEYKDILKEIYPKRTIKGFLIYLDPVEVEEVVN